MAQSPQWQTDALELLESYVPRDREDRGKAFLTALVHHAPTLLGRWNICESISKCPNMVTPEKSLQELLYELSQHYFTGLILPIRAQGGKTPKISDRPSRQESMDQETMLNELFLSDENVMRDRGKVRDLLLLRDNYRSVICGQVDLASYRKGRVGLGQGTRAGACEGGHILPFSLGTNQPQQSQVWTTISSFAGEDLALELGGSNINRFGNMLTLSTGEHEMFG